MKVFNILKYAAPVLALGLLTACTEDDSPTTPVDPGVTISCVTNGTLKAQIDSSCTLPGDTTYNLAGLTNVKSGATLTIGAGAVIKGRADGAISALVVEQGAKLVAIGTSTNPIVFTSGRTGAQRGDFGGVVILGNAPMNAVGGTGEIEGLVGVPYGGTNATDSSGVLQYVRIEYAGRILGTNNELNGLTMGGVGSRTKVSYVQVFEGLDDGFEWFGGTVSGDHLVVVGADDDLFDWDAGWQGTVQFALGVHNLSVNTDANGIEADSKDGSENAHPRSAPKLANVTLIGNGVSSLNGMRLRRGTAGQITNALVTGFKAGRAVRIDGNNSIRLVNNDSLKVTSLYAYNNGGRTNVAAAAGLADSAATILSTNTKLATWFTADTASVGVSINVWKPTTTPAGAVAVPNGFSAATYIGAFDPASSALWTAGWARGI